MNVHYNLHGGPPHTLNLKKLKHRRAGRYMALPLAAAAARRRGDTVTRRRRVQVELASLDVRRGEVEGDPCARAGVKSQVVAAMAPVRLLVPGRGRLRREASCRARMRRAS